MKKITIIIISILTFHSLNSCFLAITGAHHTHFYDEVPNIEDKLYFSVFCAPLWKTYKISGVENSDKVFIRSSVFKNPNEYYYLDKSNDNTKSYDLKIGDMKFHRKFTDTIFIKIINEKNIESLHKFIPKKNLNE